MRAYIFPLLAVAALSACGSAPSAESIRRVTQTVPIAEDLRAAVMSSKPGGTFTSRSFGNSVGVGADTEGEDASYFLTGRAEGVM